MGQKITKISRFVLYNKIEEGGLKLPNIAFKIKSWQQTWIKRAYECPESNWVKILNLFLQDKTFVEILNFNCQMMDHL